MTAFSILEKDYKMNKLITIVALSASLLLTGCAGTAQLDAKKAELAQLQASNSTKQMEVIDLQRQVINKLKKKVSEQDVIIEEMVYVSDQYIDMLKAVKEALSKSVIQNEELSSQNAEVLKQNEQLIAEVKVLRKERNQALTENLDLGFKIIELETDSKVQNIKLGSEIKTVSDL